MKKVIYKIALLSIAIFGLISCENKGYEDYEQVKNPTIQMDGEWIINITESGVLKASHALHKTYDSNDGKLWIDDAKHGWWLKGKLIVNPTDLTFNVANEPNLLDPGTTFTITEGKIIKNGGKSKTGVVVDSIYFKAVFSYEPGKTYIHSGHKRTGFEEDEY